MATEDLEEAMAAMEAMEDSAVMGDTGAMEATSAYAPHFIPTAICMAAAAWDWRADIMVVLMVMAVAIILDIRPLAASVPPAAASLVLVHSNHSLKWIYEIKNQNEKLKSLAKLNSKKKDYTNMEGRSSCGSISWDYLMIPQLAI